MMDEVKDEGNARRRAGLSPAGVTCGEWPQRGQPRDNPPPAPGEVRVWLATPAIHDPQCRLDLTHAEQRRLSRCMDVAARGDVLTGMVLLRRVLASYTGVPPLELRFARNRWGKPHLLAPAAPLLCFSLTHTRGLAALAVCRGHDVGLDVEWIDPAAATCDVAARVMSPRELSRWLALPQPQRTRVFYQVWTAKEAIAKATGRGLQDDFGSIEVPPLAAAPNRFIVTALSLPANYAGTVAGKRMKDEETRDARQGRLSETSAPMDRESLL